MRFIERWPLHPFLFSLFSVLVAFASNPDSMTWPQVIRPLAISEILALLLLIVGRGLFSDWRRAAIFSTFLILAIFSYGHVFHLAHNWVVGGISLGRHQYLLVVSAMVVLGVSYLLHRKHLSVDLPTSALNIVGAILFVLLATNIPISERKLEIVDQGATLPKHLPGEPVGRQLPDIYYIVLDGYGREDILSRLYGYDNSGFVDWLEGQDFYVADQGHANYLSTALSLTSSLNMQYIPGLQDAYNFPSYDIPVDQLIDESVVRLWLLDEGYKTVAFDTGYLPTTIEDADVFVRADSYPSGIFDRLVQPHPDLLEGYLLYTGIYRAYQDYQTERGNPGVFEASYSEHRDRIHAIFSTLETTPLLDGPHFVFAHVIAPHPPFVFGPNGEPLTPSYFYTLADHHDDFIEFGTRSEYLRGYVGQLEYVNKLVEETVSSILDQSELRPIIIIQGDHGPGAYYTTDSLAETYLPERASNLNAYLVPDSMKKDLYPSITPVNSFRLLFRDVFEIDIDLLTDQTYFSVSDALPVDPSVSAYPLPSPARPPATSPTP